MAIESCPYCHRPLTIHEQEGVRIIECTECRWWERRVDTENLVAVGELVAHPEKINETEEPDED